MVDNFRYLRPIKARKSKECFNNLSNETGKLSVRIFENVHLNISYNNPTYGMNELAHYGNSAYVGLTSCLDRSKRHFTGNVLFAGFFLDAWGHFLMQSTTRLWYMFSEDISTPIEKIVFVSQSKNFSGFRGNIKNFIELSGLKDKIEVVTDDFSCDKLIVPDEAISHFHYSMDFIKVFDKVRSTALEQNQEALVNPKNKVFLTRSKLKNANKNEINIQYLDRFFIDNGYQIVSPERCTLTELIISFANADEISSIEGTLAHNILFAPKGTKFNIISRHGFINSWQMICDITSSNPATFVDCFELPTMSEPIGCVFLYQSTEEMRKWAKDNNMKQPIFPVTDKERKQELKNFLKRCEIYSGHTPLFLPYDIKRSEVYAEAIYGCEKIYGKWTRRTRPLFIRDYFSFSCHKKWWMTRLKNKILELTKFFL